MRTTDEWMAETMQPIIDRIAGEPMSHTPGPWFQSHRKSVYGGYRTEIYTEDGEVVATAAWYPKKLTETTTGTYRDPNARLIAAAPDLLEALADMMQWVAAFSYGQGGKAYEEVMRSPRMSKAQTAIAKATGANHG